MPTMKPRFGWKIETDIPAALQKKYHIEVTDAEGCVWDSGEIESDQSIFVDYAGKPLAYQTRYNWRVRVYVGGVWSDWSEKAWFETALEKWTAPFIQADDTPEDSAVKTFGKNLKITKPLKSARVYATSLGIYEMYIGGKPITDTCFNPGWTVYDARLLYQTFDVTDMLAEGENHLTASVAPGWYKGDLCFTGVRGIFGEKLAFSAQINLFYMDGSCETILTDEDWQFKDNPIGYTELYHGEIYDARKENLENWQPIAIHPTGNFEIESFDGNPVRRVEILKPIAFMTTPKGEKVLDFGQNLTGQVKFKVSGKAGDKVTLRHAEVLDKDGNFYTENLRAARCTNTYILKGDEVETYEPFFTFQGFRYVAIDEIPGDVNPEDFEAIVIHSDMKKIGEFTCSDPLINQLQSNITWGLRGNFLDIPTDCPQRDERLGWTGDAQVFIHTACFLYDVLPFFRKWLKDLKLDQHPDGGVPYVIPDTLRRSKKWTSQSHSACGWADAAVIVPWAVYESYGDKRVLEDQYESMRGWVEYIRAVANGHLFNTGNHMGDWVALDAKEGSYVGATPTDLCATAYYAYSTSLLAKTAEVLGKTADVEKYNKLHAEIVNAYQNEFFTPSGRLAARTQTAHILSLVFDLTPEAFIPRTIETLVKLIEENGGHLVTGFLGTPYFCHALSQNNRLEEAYKLLERKDYPSWLYQVKIGATTIWEHMDGIKPDGSMWSADMNSFNHYAYGAIGEWLYKVVVGLNPLEPGYKRIKIEPKPGGNLTMAAGKLDTPYGMVESKWELKGGKTHIAIKIPPNTTAEVILPNGNKHVVGSGDYSYVY